MVMAGTSINLCSRMITLHPHGELDRLSSLLSWDILFHGVFTLGVGGTIGGHGRYIYQSLLSCDYITPTWIVGSFVFIAIVVHSISW